MVRRVIAAGHDLVMFRARKTCTKPRNIRDHEWAVARGDDVTKVL